MKINWIHLENENIVFSNYEVIEREMINNYKENGLFTGNINVG